MPLLAAAALLAAVESASPQGPESRLGVLCLGPDASAAGDLQRVLELRLNALKEVRVVGASDIAEKVGASLTPPIAPDPALEKEKVDLLATVRDAYYRNDAPRALEHIAKLELLRERSPVREADKEIKIRLWKAAIYMALERPDTAESEAMEALKLDPALEVDLETYKPSLAKEVARIKKKIAKPVRVTVTDLPAGSTIDVDGIRVGSSFSVLPGKHRITVRAPHRREWSREMDVKADLSLRPSLALAIESGISNALSHAIWESSIDAPAAQALTNLFGQTGADWVLVVATRIEPTADVRALLVSLEPKRFRFSATSSLSVAPAAIADWAEKELAQADTAPQPEPTNRVAPIPTATPRPRSGRGGNGFYAMMSAGPVIPMESNYAPGQVRGGLAMQPAFGWAMGKVSLETGAHFSAMHVGFSPATVTEPFLALRWSAFRIGPTEIGFHAGGSPWTLFQIRDAIPIREGTTQVLCGWSADAGVGFRRDFGGTFLAGDARYLVRRYVAADAAATVSTQKQLRGDVIAVMLGGGIQF